MFNISNVPFGLIGQLFEVVDATFRDVDSEHIPSNHLNNYRQALENKLKNISAEKTSHSDKNDDPAPIHPGEYPSTKFILKTTYRLLKENKLWDNDAAPTVALFTDVMHADAQILRNEIMEAPFGLKPNMGLVSWLLSEHVGLSSKMLAGVLSGNAFYEISPPRDLGDFARCEWLLQAEPSLRKELHRMEQFSCWRPFLKHWDELVALLPPVPGSYASTEANKKFRVITAK